MTGVLRKLCFLASVVSSLVACTSVGHKALDQKAGTAPAPLELVLKPHLGDRASVDYVDVRLAVGEPDVPSGGSALRMPLVIVGIPTARYDGNAIAARDASGELPLTQQDEAPTPTGTYRRWLASRASVGDVTYTFRAVPRVVSASTRTGPLFDLRAEGQGLNGAGITFLALPDTKQPYRVSLSWDLSAMPAGSIGVSSLGEGEIATTIPAEQLAFSFYAAGPLKRYPQDAENFAMYWFGDPPFDTRRLGAGIQQLFDQMAPFFDDPGGAYRVFIRRNPHAGGGGTALTRSFMFGYSDGSTPSSEDLQGLLAHEMTHNWPSLEGEHGATAWYLEGAAGYYSILLSYRAGVLTSAQFLKAINERALAYYTNPYRELTNAQAAEKFWSDSRAQKIPYGRGFMYLAKVDAEIRARTNGNRSLRDLVLALRKLQREGKPNGIEEWLHLVTAELGPQARPEFDAMVAGKLIVPPTATFTPCFRLEPAALRAPDLGFDSGYAAAVGTRIAGLDPQSPAFSAGVRNGDEIAAPIPSLDELQANAALTLKLRRDGAPLDVTFAPAAREVQGYQWVRVGSTTDEVCLAQRP
jgi:hypothetical protein